MRETRIHSPSIYRQANILAVAMGWPVTLRLGRDSWEGVKMKNLYSTTKITNENVVRFIFKICKVLLIEIIVENNIYLS
jgi:hypothetical protein